MLPALMANFSMLGFVVCFFLFLKLVYLKKKELALLIAKIMIQNSNFDYLCKSCGIASLNGLLRCIRLCRTLNMMC